MEKESIGHFLKYNNTVPIVLGILFLSTSATMAASPAVRDSVYSAETTVRSVDNSYVVALDVEDYPFAMRVVSILEDDEYLYVEYEFDTVDVADYVWQDVTRVQKLTVSKALLQNQDFKSYVESELAQVLGNEIAHLTEVKASESRKGMSEKVVATEYSGLVGKFIEPSEERVPQYVSVVDKNDPLAIKNPKPLLTWDANAKPKPVVPPRQEEDDETPPAPVDQCPDLEGLQESASECPSGGGGEEEPPVGEPPVEEPPVEEPPAEEPPVEEPPAENPGEGDTGGDTGGESGGESSGDSGGEGTP